jgi:hypothetical protein
MPYWVNTSENRLIKDLLQRHAFAVEKEIQALLEGGTIEKKLNETTVFSELEEDEMALWSILVLSGYLKAARSGPIIAGEPRPPFLLSIPNREVDGLYRTTFQSWMDKGLNAGGGNIKALTTRCSKGIRRNSKGNSRRFVAYAFVSRCRR